MAQTKKKQVVLSDKSDIQTARVRVFKGGHNTPPTSGPVNRPSHMRGAETKKKPRISEEVKLRALEMLKEGRSITSVADTFNISKPTVSRLKDWGTKITFKQEIRPSQERVGLSLKATRNWADKIHTNLLSSTLVVLSLASMLNATITGSVNDPTEIIAIVTQSIITALLAGKVLRG